MDRVNFGEPATKKFFARTSPEVDAALGELWGARNFRQNLGEKFLEKFGREIFGKIRAKNFLDRGRRYRNENFSRVLDTNFVGRRNVITGDRNADRYQRH